MQSAHTSQHLQLIHSLLLCTTTTLVCQALTRWNRQRGLRNRARRYLRAVWFSIGSHLCSDLRAATVLFTVRMEPHAVACASVVQETPPQTPSPSVGDTAAAIGRGLIPGKHSPRTPRKPRRPQQAATPDCLSDSALLRFELVSTPPHSVPASLKIHVSSAEKRSRSHTAATLALRGGELRSRRRLWLNRDYDKPGTADYFQPCRSGGSSPPPGKRLRRDVTAAFGDSWRSTDTDGTDADDEMEGVSPKLTTSSLHLSPPLSPQWLRARTPPIQVPLRSEAACFGAQAETLIKPRALASSSGTSAGGVTGRKSSLGTKVKICASCKTRKTPLWRDSEDGTPYCNACGIRFKKYHVRCSSCLYIPRKDEKTGNVCCVCSARLVQCRFR